LSSEYGIGADMDQNTAILELRRKNILSYPSVTRTAEVLARLVRYGQYRQQKNWRGPQVFPADPSLFLEFFGD
jgi:hypothetical protein